VSEQTNPKTSPRLDPSKTTQEIAMRARTKTKAVALQREDHSIFLLTAFGVVAVALLAVLF
jgi:hypothetical protein